MPDPTATQMEPAAPTGSSAGTPDRHSRGRERRRNRVYECALALFMEKGFEETTMDDIAERGDVARTSVFNYFPRKTEFLEEWGVRRRQRALGTVDSEHPEDGSVHDVLHRYMGELAEQHKRSRAESVVMMGASLRWNNFLHAPPLATELAAVLERARLGNQLRADVDTELAGLHLAVGYFAALASWIAVEPEPFDIRDYLAKLVDLTLNGLLAPPAPADARPKVRAAAAAEVVREQAS